MYPEARYLTHEVVNSRLRITLPTIWSSGTGGLALLNCVDESKRSIGICLERSSCGSFTRRSAARLIFLSVNQTKRPGATKPRSLLIDASVPSVSGRTDPRKECSIRIEFLNSRVTPDTKLAVSSNRYKFQISEVCHQRTLEIEDAQFACFDLEVGFATIGLMDNQPVLLFTKKTVSFPHYVDTLQQDLLENSVHLHMNGIAFCSDKAEMTNVQYGSKGWYQEHFLLTSKKMRIASRLW